MISDNIYSTFQEKCNYFQDKDAQKAFKELINELVSESPVPDYNQILAVLDTAISSIEAKSKPEIIDWMGRASEATPSKKSKYSKLISNFGDKVRR